MTGPELKKKRQNLMLTQAELAFELRVTQNTISRWERGDVRIPAIAELVLQHLAAESRGPQPYREVDNLGRVYPGTSRSRGRHAAPTA